MARDAFGREAVAEPLTAPPDPTLVAHPRGDWAARTRSTALDALRYARFVAVMKRALPVAAVAILGSVVAYSVIPRHQDRTSLIYQRTGTLKNDLAMTRPRLSGTDAMSAVVSGATVIARPRPNRIVAGRKSVR